MAHGDDPIGRMPYPEGEAKVQGIEGETLLRIEVDERGRVHNVRILRSVGGGGPGHALDELARKVAYQMKFKPALDKRGKPVAYVLPTWHVTWKLEQ